MNISEKETSTNCSVTGSDTYTYTVSYIDTDAWAEYAGAIIAVEGTGSKFTLTSAQNVEVTCFSETSVSTHNTTRD